jgi:LruC domain-containing protein
MKIYHYTLLLFITVSIVLLTSCRRDLSDYNNTIDIQTMDDLKVPINFDWNAKQQVEIVINMTDFKAYSAKSRLSVFSREPDKGGSLIVSGAVSSAGPFTANVSLPAYAEEVFVLLEPPFGMPVSKVLPIEGGIAAFSFSPIKSRDFKSGRVYKSNAQSPDCNTGCDVYVSGGGTVNITGGQTYCVQDDFDGNINFQNNNGGGILRICGEAIIKNSQYLTANSEIEVAEGGYLEAKKAIQLAGGKITIYNNAEADLDVIELGNEAEFYVYEDAGVEVKNFNGWGNNGYLENWGTIEVQNNSYHSSNMANYGNLIYEKKLNLNGLEFFNAGTLEVGDKFEFYDSNGSFENQGTFLGEKDMEFGNNTVVTNNGTITAEKRFRIYNDASLINNGSIIVEDVTEISTNGTITNNCSFVGEKNINFSGNPKIIMNTGLLKSVLKINLWINQTVDLFDNSQIEAQNMDMECSIEGSGLASSVIVTNNLNVWNSNDKFIGTIEVATISGSLNSGGPDNFADGAYITSIEDAENYIPVDACNQYGFGDPVVIDYDLDSIPDNGDDFPVDPDRAFESFLPDLTQYATIAFEDLWPSKGDYDFNDLVIAFWGTTVTNGDNMLVDINFSFKVMAVGAGLNNGFAFQLDNITPDLVDSVSGAVLQQGYTTIAQNGLETGQSKAVVIVTESVNDVIQRPGGSFFNTVPGNPKGTSDTINIVMTFTQPIDKNLFSLESFNPFIIKNQQRDVEIHLPGKAPTDLMNTDLFGTLDDASNPVAGVYYVTTTNLPWGLFILEPFDYPIEDLQIIDAYNFFKNWAESGGSIYSDWYLNLSGYRNSENIYLE